MSGEATISPADRTAWQLTADATGEATDAWKRLPEPAMTGLDAPVGYIPAPATVDAVNVALALGQPLLVTGEPGCGKSALAGWVAHRLGVFPALRFQTRSTATARDLFYMFDAVGRFNAAQNLDANGNRPSIDPRSYITYTGLGAAVLRALPPAERNGLIDPARPDPFGTEPQRSVVLIDEIDKAPRDFPNDVLAELENFAFTIPELRGIAAAAPKAMPPIVIITSNNERALPDAFLRRCLYHNMSFPEAAVLEQIVYARIKAIPVGSRLVQGAIRITETLRSAGLRKQPGIAELLAFILALRARGARSDSAVEIVPRWESDAMITMVKVPGDQARAQAALRARAEVPALPAPA